MANTYLTRTPSSTGNKQTFTFSAWKRSKVSSVLLISSSNGETNYFIIR